MSRKIGADQEHRAWQFLKQQGLKLLARNYYAHHAEIDLICQDQQTIVFIEVRYRQHTHYGNSAESVTFTKQQHLIHAATQFLQQKKWATKYSSRFDVIAINAHPDAPIQWIKNAFECI